MRIGTGVAGAIAILVSCGNLQAVETWTGRWATDTASCSAFGASETMLVATDYALRWADRSCRIGKSYKVGKSVHIQAHCWDGGANRDISVTLTTQGERLAMTWDNRAVKDMRRCQ